MTKEKEQDDNGLKTVKKKKTRKVYVSISTHIEEKDLILLKAILKKENKTVYSYLKACAEEIIAPYRIDAVLGLPPIPSEDDLLG